MKKKRMSVLTVLLTMCAATFAQGLKDVYKDYSNSSSRVAVRASDPTASTRVSRLLLVQA